jgi:hypothetical protein
VRFRSVNRKKPLPETAKVFEKIKDLYQLVKVLLTTKSLPTKPGEWKLRNDDLAVKATPL